MDFLTLKFLNSTNFSYADRVKMIEVTDIIEQDRAYSKIIKTNIGVISILLILKFSHKRIFNFIKNKITDEKFELFPKTDFSQTFYTSKSINPTNTTSTSNSTTTNNIETPFLRERLIHKESLKKAINKISKEDINSHFASVQIQPATKTYTKKNKYKETFQKTEEYKSPLDVSTIFNQVNSIDEKYYDKEVDSVSMKKFFDDEGKGRSWLIAFLKISLLYVPISILLFTGVIDFVYSNFSLYMKYKPLVDCYYEDKMKKERELKSKTLSSDVNEKI